MKKSLFTSTLILTLTFPSTLLAGFTDLSTDHPNYEAIISLQAAGCLNGYEDGSVRPENSIARAESLKLLLTCLDNPTIYSEDVFTLPAGSSYIIDGNETTVNSEKEIVLKTKWNPDNYPALQFSDVITGSWYETVLKEALVRKLITGYADGTIKPENTVTKGEFFTILHRLVPEDLQVELAAETQVSNDVFSGQWYANGLSFALDQGFTQKDTDGNLNPFKQLTRGNVAEYLYQYDKWITKKLNPTSASEEAEVSTETETTTETDTTTTNLDQSNFEVGQTETGIASYYSDGLAGANTASGERFDPTQLVAAHKTLPFGTIVKVTNPSDEKWVNVRIIDRGPYVEGRILDLSTTAFEALAPLSRGIVEVTLEVQSLP